MKQEIRQFMAKLGHAINDLGACNAEPSDFPGFPEIWGRMAYCEDRGSRHLICGSGTGVCVAANKVPSIRAGICHGTDSAHQGVEHDDMNVLVMGSRIVGTALAREITEAYLGAKFDEIEKRFVRRLNKAKAIERLSMRAAAP